MKQKIYGSIEWLLLEKNPLGMKISDIFGSFERGSKRFQNAPKKHKWSCRPKKQHLQGWYEQASRVFYPKHTLLKKIASSINSKSLFTLHSELELSMMSYWCLGLWRKFWEETGVWGRIKGCTNLSINLDNPWLRYTGGGQKEEPRGYLSLSSRPFSCTISAQKQRNKMNPLNLRIHCSTLESKSNITQKLIASWK